MTQILFIICLEKKDLTFQNLDKEIKNLICSEKFSFSLPKLKDTAAELTFLKNDFLTVIAPS